MDAFDVFLTSLLQLTMTNCVTISCLEQPQKNLFFCSDFEKFQDQGLRRKVYRSCYDDMPQDGAYDLGLSRPVARACNQESREKSAED